MRVLIFHMRYEPDTTGTAPLVTQLAQDLVRGGMDTTVIASLPHYGRNSVHPDYQDKKKLFHKSRENGVDIFRTPVYLPRHPGLLQRAINYLSYNFFSIIAGLMVKDVDIVLAINPPITTTFSAWIISVIYRTPLLVGIQDIWPDCLIQIGQISNRFVIAISKVLEKVQYLIARNIIVLSEGMKKNLEKKGVKEDKITVIANWADLDEVIPGPKENHFFNEQELNDLFIVLYAGNHGYIAALDSVIDAADQLREHKDILFLFAGEGNVKKGLVKLAKEKRLANVRFIPTQSKESWLEMLAASDLGLVTLRKDLAELNVPSKVYTLMSAERPILASVPEYSEIVNLVNEAECGFITPPEDPIRLAKAILESKNNNGLKTLGKNGRLYLEENFHRRSQTELYLKLINQYKEG